MILSKESFENLLPPYLHDTKKARIHDALSQFFSDNNQIEYSGFYSLVDTDFLMQSDVIISVPGILWNETGNEVEAGYNSAMLMSNSCDTATDKSRSINLKDAMVAPLVSLADYINECKEAGFTGPQIDGFVNSLRCRS